jgi:hypothetical protein
MEIEATTDQAESVNEHVLQILIDMEEGNRWALLWHAVASPTAYRRALHSHLQHTRNQRVWAIVMHLTEGGPWWKSLWHQAWNPSEWQDANALVMFQSLPSDEQDAVLRDLYREEERRQTPEACENR